MLIAACFLVGRLSGLLLDATPRFFLGDSGSYLETALTGWVPPDRSYLYGLLLRGLFNFWPTLTAVVLLQSLAGVLTGIIFWATLRLRLHVGRWTSAVLTGLFFLDPFVLYYERAVLTESLSLLFFSAFIYFMLGAMARDCTTRYWHFFAVELCAWGVVLVRQSFLPYVVVALIFMVGVIAWRARSTSDGTRWFFRWCSRMFLGGLLVGVFVGGLSIYSQIVSRVHGCPAQLSRADGYFLSAYYAPIITPELVEDDELRRLIFTEPRHPMADPDYFLQRMFSPDGMIDRVLTKYHGDPTAEKNRVLKRIALRALVRHPIGAGRIVLGTLRDYFDLNKIEASLYTALSMNLELSNKQKERYQASLGLAYNRCGDSFLTQTLLHSSYLQLLRPILSVFAFLCIFVWGAYSAEALLLFLTPVLLLGLNCAMTLMDVRYLHAHSLVILLAIGCAFHCFRLVKTRNIFPKI